MIECPKCGRMIREDSVTCIYCKEDLEYSLVTLDQTYEYPFPEEPNAKNKSIAEAPIIGIIVGVLWWFVLGMKGEGLAGFGLFVFTGVISVAFWISNYLGARKEYKAALENYNQYRIRKRIQKETIFGCVTHCPYCGSKNLVKIQAYKNQPFKCKRCLTLFSEEDFIKQNRR